MNRNLLKDSTANKKNLIPADYDSRINSLLASLPDEHPVQECTEAEVIKHTGRTINIRPFVSAAAVFAIAAAGLFTAGGSMRNALDKGHEPGKVYVTTASVTTTAAQTTAVTTTPVTSEITNTSETEQAAASEEQIYTEERLNSVGNSDIIQTPEQHTDNPPEPSENPPSVPAEPATPEAPEPPSPEEHVHPEQPLDPEENNRPGINPGKNENEHPVHPEVPVGPAEEAGHKDKADKDRSPEAFSEGIAMSAPHMHP